MSAGPPLDDVVPAALDGQRLDRVISILVGCSRNVAADLISGDGVVVDGTVVHGRAQRLRAGQRVTIVGGVPVDDDVPLPQPVSFTVVHEDADLIVVDKPAGLVVHPGSGNRDRTLVNGLLDRYPAIAPVGEPSRPGIVHRLDKGTSGLLLVARSERAYERLVAMLAAHDVERVYHALVWNTVEEDAGEIDAPIGRSVRDPTRMAVTPRGRPGRTQYRVLARHPLPELTLVECRLETGRTHQIRVHLSSIGHPVVGDERYGGVRGGLVVDRPWLHASALRFDHPATGDPMAFTSPLPADLAEVAGRAGVAVGKVAE